MRKLIATIGIMTVIGTTGLVLGGKNDNIINPVPYVTEEGKEEVRYKYVTDREVPVKELGKKKEILSKRTPRSITFKDGEEFTTRIYTSDQFQEKDGKWFEIDMATSTKEEFEKENFSFIQRAFAEVFYSSTSDAFIYNGGSSECALGQPWSGCHDATSGDLTTANADFNVGSGRIAISDAWFFQRAFIPFDTSVIPVQAVVSATTLNLKPTVINGDTGTTTDFVRVVQTSQAANTVANADFDQCGSIDNPTAGASDVDMNSFATSTYYAFALNSTGLGWIKKNGQTSNCGTTAGWTCLGLREGHDALDREVPTGKRYSIGFASADTAGTGSDPYLDITYAIPTPSGELQIKDGVLQIKDGVLQIKS